jgi:hypothetical protein
MITTVAKLSPLIIWYLPIILLWTFYFSLNNQHLSGFITLFYHIKNEMWVSVFVLYLYRLFKVNTCMYVIWCMYWVSWKLITGILKKRKYITYYTVERLHVVKLCQYIRWKTAITNHLPITNPINVSFIDTT